MTQIPPRDAGPDEQSTFARWQGVSGCPPPELLGAALEGTLQPAMLAANVRAHIERCPLCRTLADALNDIEPSADEAERIRGRVIASRPATSRRALYAVAATLIVAVGGASIAWQAMKSERTVAAPAALTPQPTSGTSYVLPLDKPITELPPEALTLRSATADPYAAALEKALQPYQRDDYAAAIPALAAVAQAYPGKPHPRFYLGVSRLFDGDAAAAVDDFAAARKTAPDGSSLSAQSAWYLAIALERSGRPATAAEPLQALCAGGSVRKADACEALRALGSVRR